MFFIAEKAKKIIIIIIILNFSLDLLTASEKYKNGTSKNINFIDWSKWF